MSLWLATVAIVAAAMLLMAVGLLFKHGCLTASCGGLALFETTSGEVRCPWCPLRPREK